MMFILDTNVVSELRKVSAGKADPNVTAWAASVDAAQLFVSAITIMELELGVLSIERKDVAQGAVLRSWLEQHVLPEFSGRTLSIDSAVAQRCARLHVPDKRGERDALIAATLRSWLEPIVAMWRFSKTNGITEGFHTKMEMLSRRAYGFRNFENYRLRVLAQCGWDGVINRV